MAKNEDTLTVEEAPEIKRFEIGDHVTITNLAQEGEVVGIQEAVKSPDLPQGQGLEPVQFVTVKLDETGQEIPVAAILVVPSRKMPANPDFVPPGS